MANFTAYTDGTPVARSAGSNAASAPAYTIITNEFDAGRQNLAAADTVELMEIPAGTFVHKVFVEVLAGEAAQTMNVGDVADPDAFVAAGDVSTTGTRLMGAATAAGKFYATADKLVIECPATMEYTTLRVRVSAAVVHMG